MSLYRIVVPRIVLPLADRLGGRRLLTELARLRAAQWQSRETIEARSLADLGALLRHAAAHVPYYRDLFARAGVGPGDVRTLADLARVPTTTKADLRDAPPHAAVADNLPAHRRRKMTTSGSAGAPFEFYWDHAGHDLRVAAYMFSLDWAGVNMWDTRIAVIIPSSFATNTEAPSPLAQIGRRLALGEQHLRLPADQLSPAAFHALLERIPRRRRYFLRGYPSAIAWLARQLTAGGAPVRTPAAVITYAESLTPVDAAAIREAFRCPVANYYTAWDVPHVAQTCPDRADTMHVATDRLIVRIVGPDGRDVPAGTPGRVVVTDLSNPVMPLINYDLGDQAVPGTPCPCGRGFPTLAWVDGRSSELIHTPGGKRISGTILGHFLAFEARVTPGVVEYQAVQPALDRVTLRVVPGHGYTPAFAAAIAARLEAYLGPGVAVAIETVDAIPREPSGKRLIIRSELPARQIA